MSRVTDYDSISSEYDRRYREQEYAATERALTTFIGKEHNVDVLEVGCGTGHWLNVLAEQTGFLTGFDLFATMLQRAHELVPEAPLERGAACSSRATPRS